MRILERHTKSSDLYLFGLAASGLSGVVGYQCNLLRIIFEYHKQPVVNPPGIGHPVRRG